MNLEKIKLKTVPDSEVLYNTNNAMNYSILLSKIKTIFIIILSSFAPINLRIHFNDN